MRREFRDTTSRIAASSVVETNMNRVTPIDERR